MQTQHVPLPTMTLGTRPQTPQIQTRPPIAVLTTPLLQGRTSMQHPRLQMVIQPPHPQPLRQHQNSLAMRPMHRRRSVGNQRHRGNGLARMCQGMRRRRRVLRDGKTMGVLKAEQDNFTGQRHVMIAFAQGVTWCLGNRFQLPWKPALKCRHL